MNDEKLRVGETTEMDLGLSVAETKGFSNLPPGEPEVLLLLLRHEVRHEREDVHRLRREVVNADHTQASEETFGKLDVALRGLDVLHQLSITLDAP